jgi:hypothetical protein
MQHFINLFFQYLKVILILKKFKAKLSSVCRDTRGACGSDRADYRPNSLQAGAPAVACAAV